MADGHNHPFNNDVIDFDSIVQSENPFSHLQQRNVEKHHQHKDLLDILYWNNSHEQSLNSHDSTFSVTLHSISDDDFKRLKYLIRSVLWPIDHCIRQQLWMNIITVNRFSLLKQQHTNSRRHTSQTALTTLSVITDHNLNNFSLKYSQWPHFIDTNKLCFYYLNDPIGHSLLHRILLTIAIHHPDLTYCPSIQPISALLLHYHNENEVLYLLNHLLNKNWLCGGTHLQWQANANVFKRLLRLYYKRAANIIDLRYTNTDEFYQEWFWWIFRYLPYSYLAKIMDCMLLEGPKILFRISLALVHLFTKRLKHQSKENIENITDFCQQIPVTLDKLLYVAFHIRNFKRRTIDELLAHEESLLRSTRHLSTFDETNQNNNRSISNHRSSSIMPHHFTQIPQKSILNHQQFLTLWSWLPVRLSLSQPVLVFTTEEHGFRLQTLLNKIDELEYSILIIKTTNDEIFGGFCAGLWSDRHNRTYFGFGESFLFTLIPKQIKYSWVGQQQDDNNRQNQAKREMFLFVNNEKLIIGGGNGDGLCIDQSLCEGRTSHCETFNNEPLCSQSYFSISVLEMIAFDSSSS